jgi:hypothetical protein
MHTSQLTIKWATVVQVVLLQLSPRVEVSWNITQTLATLRGFISFVLFSLYEILQDYVSLSAHSISSLSGCLLHSFRRF